MEKNEPMEVVIPGVGRFTRTVHSIDGVPLIVKLEWAEPPRKATSVRWAAFVIFILLACTCVLLVV